MISCLVLIETLWNVNFTFYKEVRTVYMVLIETLWNVNKRQTTEDIIASMY